MENTKDYLKTKGRIFDIQRFSVHDGPGIRTIVFLKGCVLRCKWCCNPESQSYEIQTMTMGGETRTVGRDVTVEEVMNTIRGDLPYYRRSGGGVTLSGGECLTHADFCAELLRRLQSEGIRTAVDTCGDVPKEAIDRVIPYTDIFLYDLKAVDEEVHKRCTGRSNRRILENLRYIDACGRDIEIRIPYVPGYNDGEINAMAALLSKLTHLKKVRLLAYHNYAGSKYASLDMTNTLPARLPTEEELDAALAILTDCGLNTIR